MRRTVVVLALAWLMSALSGCAPTSTGATTAVSVVASTDVWGDIAKQVGGARITVTSIIGGSRDPHEYETTIRDQLAVSKAALVVENGAGYDPFMTQLTKRTADGTRIVDAATVSGKDLRVGDFDEHLWYDFPTVEKVAGAIEQALVRADPRGATGYRERFGAFRAAVTRLESAVTTMRARTAGLGVAITEPVPVYLTDALGMIDRTPRAFSTAIEDDTDVPPTVLAAQLRLFASHRVALLAWNEQTTGATTTQVLAAAKAAGVPAVGVRETLPAKTGYLAWMRGDLAAIAAAVGS